MKYEYQVPTHKTPEVQLGNLNEKYQFDEYAELCSNYPSFVSMNIRGTE